MNYDTIGLVRLNSKRFSPSPPPKNFEPGIQTVQLIFTALVCTMLLALMPTLTSAQTPTEVYLSIIDDNAPDEQSNSIPERRNRNTDYNLTLKVPTPHPTDFQIKICFDQSTASYGDDYQLFLPGNNTAETLGTDMCTKVITVTGGTTSMNFRIRVLADMVDENQEEIKARLKRVTPGNPPVNEDDEVIISIRDIEVRFEEGSASVSENVGTYKVKVEFINKGPLNDLTLKYSLGGTATPGSDYEEPTEKTVTVPKGSTMVEIPITILNSIEREEDESIILNLVDSQNYKI